MRIRVLSVVVLVASAALLVGLPGRATFSLGTGCPELVPPTVRPTLHSSGRLVPFGAQTLLLCRYRGLNAGAGARRLRSARLLRIRAQIEAIAALLNALPQISGIHCPMDDGSEIVASFSYPGGARLVVQIGLTGCRTVTSTRLPVRTASGPSGARLITRLERLVR